MFNIQNALKLGGWMRPDELMWLAEQASTRKRICEVGSWMGRSTRALADSTTGVVYAVDTWEGTPGPKECGLLLAGKPSNWLFDQFLTNMGTLAYSTVRPVVSASVRGAMLLGRCGWSFDMIFLDAAHDYESVKADIQAWRPLLVDGGLLCGHDYGASFPGVAQAVDELLPGACKVGAGTIWAAK